MDKRMFMAMLSDSVLFHWGVIDTVGFTLNPEGKVMNRSTLNHKDEPLNRGRCQRSLPFSHICLFLPYI